MKQMRQPRKDVLREQLALAADEIIRLRFEASYAEMRHANERAYCTRHIEYLTARRWWHRLAWWRA